MSPPLPCSVILAAHGSLADPRANEPLFELAKSIRSSGVVADVQPAFLNGQPNATNVFEHLPEGNVVIVPMMTSDGYYLNQVFPNKIAENKNLAAYRTFLTPPIGLHPDLPSLASDRVGMLLSLLEIDEHQTSVIVVGHGTRRNPESEKSTLLLVERMRELSPTQEIRAAFIDQDPTISSVIAELSRPNLLVVPFLISRGPHTTVDVPEAFGLPSGPDIQFPLVKDTGQGLVVCDLPIGMYPEMAELCLDWIDQQLSSGHPIDFRGRVAYEESEAS